MGFFINFGNKRKREFSIFFGGQTTLRQELEKVRDIIIAMTRFQCHNDLCTDGIKLLHEAGFRPEVDLDAENKFPENGWRKIMEDLKWHLVYCEHPEDHDPPDGTIYVLPENPFDEFEARMYDLCFCNEIWSKRITLHDIVEPCGELPLSAPVKITGQSGNWDISQSVTIPFTELENLIGALKGGYAISLQEKGADEPGLFRFKTNSHVPDKNEERR